MHDRVGDVTRGISKAPTGISGLDELTDGGLPAGRPTLICGSAGCGKTLFSTTFLVKGAIEYNEPGVFLTFEEKPDDIVKNVASLGYNLDKLIADKKIAMDYVRIERSEIEETGDYDLEGLFVRLNYAIDSIGAKRVVLDTIETLFSGLSNQGILRAELRRLFDWLRDKGVTAVITGERGDGALTRHGLEEYVSDCVILLDNRVNDQISTRRMRIVKYRGSAHGTNEYPFLIDKHGISVMPITSVGLNHLSSTERVPSGIPDLDKMMEGKGYYRGSSILVSGMAGAGKSSVAAHFIHAACQRGEKCIYFAFEESPPNIIRNMRSIGLDLQPSVDKGLLRFSAKRPSLFGMEMHLVSMNREIQEFKPSAVAIDPISALVRDESVSQDVQAMLLRLIDLLKTQGVTALFTNLTHGSLENAKTDVQVSSLMDTWLLLYHREANGEHNRQLYLLKSRGMAHSNQVREFLMTPRGLELREAYVGPEGVLTGSARIAQEAREKAATLMRQNEVERRARDLARRRAKIEAEITALKASIDSEEEELRVLAKEARLREDQLATDRTAMGVSRASRSGKSKQ